MKHHFSTRWAVLGLALQLGQSLVNAQVFNLSDGNATAQIDVGSQQGMHNWTVQGQNQLNQQWFWFRVGTSGPEAAINSISPAVTSTFSGTRGLTTTYANAQFSVRVDYLLSGGLLGGTKSIIGEEITIHNLSGTALDFHFFQYSDFNLGGGSGTDSVVIGRNLFTGLFNTANQVRPSVAFEESVLTPGANHAEVGFSPTTLAKLNDANSDTLDDSMGLLGPGDVTWAFQWDLLINPGDSAIISKSKYVQITAVPEPAIGALGVIALAVLLMRRRS